MKIEHIVMLVISVFLAAIAQILLKISANKQYKKWIYEYLNSYVIVGYGLIFISTLITIYAYRSVLMKYGAIIEALGYVFVLVLSRIVFSEKINRNRVIGISLIIIGVVVFVL